MNYEEIFSKLNEYQMAAVLDESSACIVNANVGSGKTTVLTTKIMYLHRVKQIPYHDMMVLTFTNKAADEIKQRLYELEPNIEKEELIMFGTFHSVALNLLKNVLPIESLGYTKEFMVIEPEEEMDIANQLIHNEKLTIKYKNRLKKRLEQSLYENKDSRYSDDFNLLKELLQKEKVKQNKMTFSDLLFITNSLIEEVNTAWIIIDEVQDSDALQMELIRKLMNKETRLFAVGDPNQVIYSWRGSTYQVFYKLKQQYGATELSLPINYRSTSSILEAARYFLQSGNKLIGAREIGNKIIIKKHYNAFNEAFYLAEHIKGLHQNNVSYKEIAIFYRLQNQSQVLEDVFTRENIPYEVSLKKTIRDYPVLDWMIKVFRFSLNPMDETSKVFVLNHKDYGDKTQSFLLNQMLLFCEKFQYEADVEAIIEYFKLPDYLHPTSASFAKDMEAIKELLSIIFEYCKEKQLPFLDGLSSFINSSALYGMNILQKNISNNSDTVKLMTLHASKGLEFNYVFIIGANQGLIPIQTKSEEEEEEERRLFFVGITRAKNNLEISYYTNPDIYRTMPGPGRYLQMIPPRLVQNESMNNETVNLKELKKEIQRMQSNNVPVDACEPESIAENKRRQVTHKKYGIGYVQKEDDMMMEVLFDDYGIKEFMKMFTQTDFL